MQGITLLDEKPGCGKSVSGSRAPQATRSAAKADSGRDSIELATPGQGLLGPASLSPLLLSLAGTLCAVWRVNILH